MNMPPRGYKKPQHITSMPELEKRWRQWEYMTLSSEQPLKIADYNIFGADGWELVTVYVRMDAVHAVFKREVV